jgi:hypothetical protein
MRPRSAAVIACRVIALWVGIEALTSIVSLIVLVSETRHIGGTGSYWAVIVTRALIAFFLWTQAGGVGEAIARGTVDEAPASPRLTANTHAVAFSVVGLIFTINAVTDLISIAASSDEFGPLSRLRQIPFSGGGFGSGRGTAVLIQVITLGIGLFLLLGSGSLARYLSRSYPEPEPPATPPPPGAGA